MKVAEHYGSGGVYGNAKDFIAGMECELEALKGTSGAIGNFACIPDHSLRNNGVEYVTKIPQGRARLIEDFKFLHKNLAFMDKEDPFSVRTSTHVHVNVSSLTMEQTRQLILLYALFEEFFFSMVKPARRDNIHCVPLTETPLPNSYHHGLDTLIQKWSKYTGLNLKRLPDLGTVEFRHMHGTGDAAEMDVWLHCLENLWKLCQRVNVDAASLGNKTTVGEWFDAIFFPSDRVTQLRPMLFSIIKNSLIDVKFSTIQQ